MNVYPPTPEKPKRCPVCNGRGALHCNCWPCDCLCGGDDEPCDNCDGIGWIYPDHYDYLGEEDDFDA